jgi:hypothetical protein
MGNWADEAFNKLKQQEGTEHERKQQQAQTRQHILAKAPTLWDQLVDRISSETNDFNAKRAGFFKTESTAMIEGIRLEVRSPTHRIKLTFDDQQPRIDFQLFSLEDPIIEQETDQGAFRFGEARDGEVWLMDGPQGIAVEALAGKILTSLI